MFMCSLDKLTKYICNELEKSEVFKNPVTYILNDEGIEIVQGEEKAQCGWKNILKV